MLLCGLGMSPSSDHDAFYNAAPEVFEGNACLKSDVWSLGMNLIEMAGENHPFDGRSEEEVKNAVMNGVTIPSTLSPDVVDFINKCLEEVLGEGREGSSIGGRLAESESCVTE